jgi:hypothetical protein
MQSKITFCAGLLLAISTLFFACKNQPQESATGPDKRLDFTFEPGKRFGLITPEACTREAVLAAYGDSAKVDTIYVIDGYEDVGVVIFPNNPRNMVQVWWDNENDPQRPAFIRIIGDSTGTTDWKTPEGLTLGSSLAEVERLNGKPFQISGFGWDYGGRVMDWQGGNLRSSGLSFVFTPAGEVDESLLGETNFSSSDSLVKAANVVIATIEMRFLASEKLPACLEAKVNEISAKSGWISVRKMHVNGKDHYWVNDGAAAYDGIEYVYDAECNEVCKLGGMRNPDPCAQAYDSGKWVTVWEM